LSIETYALRLSSPSTRLVVDALTTATTATTLFKTLAAPTHRAFAGHQAVGKCASYWSQSNVGARLMRLLWVDFSCANTTPWATAMRK